MMFKKDLGSKRRIEKVQEGSRIFKNVKEERIPKGLRVNSHLLILALAG